VPRADLTGVILQVADPDSRLSAVELVADRALTREPREFARNGTGWVLRLARPPVERFEYLLRLHGRDGGTETVCDPANSERAPGAFGEKSVLRFPEYHVPTWLAEPGVAGHTGDLVIPCPGLGQVRTRIWSPDGVDVAEPLPLLVAHDGREYDELARLVHFIAASIGAGRVPPLRLALLEPGARDQWYSASTVYARELCGRILPTLAEAVAVAGRPVGMGASLGALAMLHAQRTYPYAFAGLFLQSGSFFVPDHDAHESGFVRYVRLVRAVRRILRGDPPGRAVPVALTCGAAEENAANNRLMARALSDQGYPARIELVPDLHNFTAWRDAFEPSLPRLLGQAWA
jgi:enterochelin esterase-like enzyme